MKDSELIASAIFNLVRMNGYNIVKSYIYELLCTHPNFPSLASISETLLLLDVPHHVYELTYSDLIGQNYSLLHLNTENEGKFVILNYATKDEISYYEFNMNRKIKISKESFLNEWSRVALEIDHELEYKNIKIFNIDRVKAIFVNIVFLFVILFFIMFYNRTGLNVYIYPLIISIIGVITTWFINRHELHIEDKFTESVCKIGKSTDCNAVLSSKASMLFGKISLGEIGISYFLATCFIFLVLPMTVNMEPFLNSLYLIAICSLPYTLFSIFYQKFIIRKWCPFCLMVILMMWGMFIVYQFILPDYFYFSFSVFLLLCLIYLISFVLVILICSLWIERNRNRNLKMKFLKIKRNPQIFRAIYGLQKEISMDYSIDDLCFGNLQSNCILTTVISESCQHCKDLTRLLIDMTESGKYDVKWVVRFYVSDNEKKSVFQNVINEYVYNKYRALSLLKSWSYNENKDLTNINIKDVQFRILNSHSVWINNNGLNFVPLIFINNKILPTSYNFNDLPLLLSNEDIIHIITADMSMLK